ncbi:hypothetical protein M409DRAFT_20864 [Zasmidium cellare ATCC 36951]|uniref:Carrier domain-containing protein n=1 Tax=Zasmidium cellare ATCC 36951 TaxID=1080233 RepID=A0A6A6CSU9_ZASCE|nr:uncharacterized protein M409DRAFT_20864 [Zasmidium cellare ATCC 36951]KAF2168849.1 hypothetical protein M409DRAFT_20864 [Zasmidium cellare ATCC 36951]
MGGPHRVYLFGDQTFDIEDSLRSLLRCNDTLVVHFFQDAYRAIRREIGRLPPHARDVFPRFSSVADLLSRRQTGFVHPAVEQFLCLSHSLATFIRDHSDGDFLYPSPESTHLIGLCTGSLAAAAVSASRNLLELVPTATEALLVAFRIGMRTSQLASSIAGSSEDGKWSMIVPSSSKDELSLQIARFVEQKALTPASAPYISAVSSTNATVSGPPRVLAEFRHHISLHSGVVELPIYGPYHAPHLFSQDDVHSILGDAGYSTPQTSGIPVLSSGTGQPIWASGLRRFLEEATKDVLLRPIVWEKAIDSLTIVLGSQSKGEVQLVPVGTAHGESIRRRLQQTMDSMNVVTQLSLLQPYSSAAGNTPPVTEPRCGRSKLAIIGTSGRFPGASSPEALWNLLMQKKDMCKEVPASRWDVDAHVDDSGKRKNTSKVRWGCWLEEPDLFDAKFFCMSPREAPQVDPAMRLALLTAYEAMEQGGVVPGRTQSTREDRVGVFFGVTSNDWCEANSAQNVDTYYIPGANRAFIPGRINYFFKFSGPSYAVDTACSSSLAALHVACNSLWRGDIDMAITGGTNLLTNPLMHAGLDRGHFLSPSGNCKTFDANADGYCRGEGVATVILKRLEDAIEDDDRILGVVSGAYTNHSAEAESITRPHVGAQKDIFERLLNDSGTSPYEVSYVEMHGTGTQAGDSREMQSVSDVFAPEKATRKRTADQSLYLGALKANIGHGESVSGVSALIKVLKMMEQKMIPPNCGVKTEINPRFPTNLSERNIHIPVEPTPWRVPAGGVRKAVINNFSAAGGNSSVLVEEYHPQLAGACTNDDLAEGGRFYPVAVSAKTPKSLQGNLRALVDFIAESRGNGLQLPQLSYTTTARRLHHPHRVIVSGSSLTDIKTELQTALAQEVGMKRAIPAKTMLFAFTGQGSQYPGMAKQLFENQSVFRNSLTHFDALARTSGFPAILPLFTGSAGNDISDYSPTVVQLANTCMQIALAKLWMSWGITPTAVVGHSLGEYAALNIAGVLSDLDTVYIVGQRANLLQQKCAKGTHAMLAVLTSVAKVQQVAQGSAFEVACINGPDETVIAGTIDEMTRLQHNFSAAGVKGTLLRVPYAFHSAQIASVKDDILQAARCCNFREPQIAVLSPLLGSVVQDASTFGPEYIARHARETVNFLQCLQVASEKGILGDSTYAIEFGPQPVVSGMIKAVLGPRMTTLPTLRRNKDCWETLTQTLAALFATGATIKWDEYFRDLPSARKVIDLPKYSWDLQSFWIEYKNDFLLTLGDTPTGNTATTSAPKRPQLAQAPPAPKPAVVEDIPKLESTSIHKVLGEENTASTYSILVETDVCRTDIMPLMEGHKVEGIGLCTPSCYADIGFSIGTYILKRYKPSFPERIVDVGHMDIEKALIAASRESHFLRTSVKLDWASKNAKCRFYTVDENAKELVQHATCTISFRDEGRFRELTNNMSSTKGRFEEMRRACVEGKTFRFNGAMAYNMVQSLADFHKDYRCIDETIYDNANYEAACTVSFGQMKHGGKFHTHPGAIDGLTQSGGFIMNANENTNLEQEVFVNHGWDSFQMFEPIRHDRQYKTLARMAPADNKQWKGDIVVWCEDRVVASIRGCCLQGVPRRVLMFILRADMGKNSKAKGQAAAPKQSKPAPTPSTAPKAPTPAPVVQQPVVAQQIMPQPQQQLVPAPAAAAPAAGFETRALEIISEQSGVAMSELQDDNALTDIGVDSLLTLTITGAFADEFEIDADTNFFEDHPTIGEVKQFFRSLAPEPNAAAAPPATQMIPPPIQAQAPAPIQYTAPVSLPVQPKVETVVDFAPAVDATSNATWTKALEIISEESGIAVSDLTDELSLADAGVDSLLSLVVSGRLQEELGLDSDSDSLLNSCETIGDLKQALGVDATAAAATVPITPHSSAPIPVSGPSVSFAMPAAPFVLEQPPAPIREVPQQTQAAPQQAYFDEPMSAPSATTANESVWQRALEILCEETQVVIQDIGDDTCLADLGVDSLLSLVVSSRFRDELDLDLGADNELVNFATVRDLKMALVSEGEGTTTPSESSSSGFSLVASTPGFSEAFTPGTELDMDFDQAFKAAQPSFVPSATSVVLQGNSKASTNTLFLFPDGSGSATSYVQLPRIASDLLVYGLNSPWLKNAEEMPASFEDLVTCFLAEVRRRQPHGPYHFAGWSAGGALAFRAAQMLIQAGEKVDSLVLLDAPPPLGLGELPQRLYDYFESVGLFKSDGKTPKWLIPHFKALTRALHTYHASPMPAGAIPKVRMLWAGRIVLETINAPPFPKQPGDSEDITFLTESRKDFSAGAWGTLLPGMDVVVDKVEDDHFGMMRGRCTSYISSFIAGAL